MEIKRKRYVVMRKNRTEIWGGLARCFNFIKISELKDTAIKTYRSEAQAKSGCSYWLDDYEIVECEEILRIKDGSDERKEETP